MASVRTRRRLIRPATVLLAVLAGLAIGFGVDVARSGGFGSFVYDTVNADEVTITVGGGLGESDIGGPLMNIIPRSGGNTFSGSAFMSTAGDWSRSENLTDDIKALNPNLQQNPGY